MLEIHKAAGAQHGLLDHQQGPPVTDLIEGAGHRAAHIVEAFTCHGGSIDQNGCIKKPNKVLLRNQIELTAREGGCADSFVIERVLLKALLKGPLRGWLPLLAPFFVTPNAQAEPVSGPA